MPHEVVTKHFDSLRPPLTLIFMMLANTIKFLIKILIFVFLDGF